MNAGKMTRNPIKRYKTSISNDSTALAFTTIGSCLGTMLASSISGYLADQFDWKTVFYVSGSFYTTSGLLVQMTLLFVQRGCFAVVQFVLLFYNSKPSR